MYSGALLINKDAGISSFGVIERLQDQLKEKHGLKRKDLPKLGHGGTLDPFATGLLIVLVGRAVKLARYFLGATKIYEGTMLFGQTTIPGDPTEAISESTDRIPCSLEEIREIALKLTKQPYLQTPPMHSAKKHQGKPLYELARAGIEIEREPKLCHLYDFNISSYENARADFYLRCSSGTYVRTLAQDLARMMGSLGLLERLDRTGCSHWRIEDAMTVEQVNQATKEGKGWNELKCWVPFDRLLDGYSRADATEQEAVSLYQGKQAVLFNILKRAVSSAETGHEKQCMAIYQTGKLIGVARQESDSGTWNIERVFLPEGSET